MINDNNASTVIFALLSRAFAAAMSACGMTLGLLSLLVL
jgi:hypothetical protein